MSRAPGGTMASHRVTTPDSTLRRRRRCSRPRAQARPRVPSKRPATIGGEPKLRPYVERILARARAAGDERLEQLAARFLS